MMLRKQESFGNGDYIKSMDQLTELRNKVRRHLAIYMEELPYNVSNNAQIRKAYKRTCRNNYHQICASLDNVDGVQRAMLYRQCGASLKSEEWYWPGSFWLNKITKCLNCGKSGDRGANGPYCKKCREL